MDKIYGKNPVYEALCTNPKRINKILILKGSHSDNRVKKIKELAQLNKINVQYAPKEKFEENYQGIVALVSPVEYADLNTFLEKSDSFKCLVILDGIVDPHNVGAIIRTCVCAGVDGIIIPNHRGALINSTVEKTSAGATNHIPIFKVNSLNAAIDRLKNKNYWIIASSLNSKDNYFEINYCNMNYAIIMGSEANGISRTLEKAADFKVKIPTKFESLNVSNALAVIVYEALRQRIQNNI